MKTQIKIYLVLTTLCLLISNVITGQRQSPDFLNRLSPEDYVVNTIIIKVKSLNNSTRLQGDKLLLSFPLPYPYEVHTLFQSASARKSGIGNILQITFEQYVDIKPLIDLILQHVEVIYATPRLIYRPDSFSAFYTMPALPLMQPDDPRFFLQWNLKKIKATDAWDISTGTPSVKIGIIDSEIESTHEDLIEQIARNEADPINGIDDDGNGLVDDFYGWDFADGDNNTVKGDNKDFFHGTPISSIAAASTNNGKGVAGVCPSCKILPIKSSMDNDTYQAITNIDGIVYAVDQGCQVINCSWGAPILDDYTRDLIGYAVDHDVLVVAAGGNYNNASPFYPADLPGVIKVAAVDSLDKKVSYSNFGPTVDVCAPTWIPAAYPGNKYGLFDGTSSATPMVAGMAALLRGYYPDYDAEAITEVIRRSCDSIDQVNPTYKGMLGAGRINLLKALTQKPVSLRILSPQYFNLNHTEFLGNDTILITGILKNYFDTLKNIHLRLVSTSPFVNIIKSEIVIPVINAKGISELHDIEFKMVILDDIPVDSEIDFKLIFEGEHYVDAQVLPSIQANQGCVYTNLNHFTTRVNSAGRIGYHNKLRTPGDELRYKTKPVAYFPLALMVGSSSAQLSDAVMYYNADGAIESGSDFNPLDIIHYNNQPLHADVEWDTRFNNANAHIVQSLEISQKILAWNDEQSKDFFIVEYTVSNKSPRSYHNIFIGLFDDINLNAESWIKDFAEEDSVRRMGYGFDVDSTTYFGIRLLGNSPFHHYAMDVYAAQNGIDLYNGYSKGEKYLSMTIPNPSAGQATNGSDVAQVVSSGPYTLAPGESVTVAFALVGAHALDSLLLNSDVAVTKYDGIVSSVFPDKDQQVPESDLYAFPNPARGTLMVHDLKGKLRSISIFSMDGKRVVFQNRNSDSVNISGLPAGYYIIALVSDNHITHQKIMIN